MDENRLEGTARNLRGKIEEGFGRATGDVDTQRRGVADQVTGAAQDAYGQAADATRNLDQWVRNMIETQPYTSALVALGIGWLLGRVHLPK
jgi:uncharacterized protein YjbJ (UPF0337 family)